MHKSTCCPILESISHTTKSCFFESFWKSYLKCDYLDYVTKWLTCSTCTHHREFFILWNLKLKDVSWFYIVKHFCDFIFALTDWMWGVEITVHQWYLLHYHAHPRPPHWRGRGRSLHEECRLVLWFMIQQQSMNGVTVIYQVLPDPPLVLAGILLCRL